MNRKGASMRRAFLYFCLYTLIAIPYTLAE